MGGHVLPSLGAKRFKLSIIVLVPLIKENYIIREECVSKCIALRIVIHSEGQTSRYSDHYRPGGHSFKCSKVPQIIHVRILIEGAEAEIGIQQCDR